ncbi:MAG: DUF2177 family protein [bacterium]
MFVKLLVESLIAFLALDALWISQIATPWMKKSVPHLMASTPNIWAAIVFYFLYLSVLLILFIVPALSHKVGYQTLAFQTFLFGLTAYATYDLTSLAVMRGYPPPWPSPICCGVVSSL